MGDLHLTNTPLLPVYTFCSQSAIQLDKYSSWFSGHVPFHIFECKPEQIESHYTTDCI